MKNRRQSIENFELLSQVEVSPMGSVYVALDGFAAQMPVLLWVFDRESMVGSASLQELESPGESPIPNPCLGEFVRCGLHRGTGFAAYERLAGPTLSEIMQRSTELEAKMPADLALMVTSGIAAALETTNDGMSDVAIPHGCLSPYFVLLMDDGPTCLFGFEIAQALIDWDRTHELRTPLSRYIAPEIRQGASPDASGDVYSLGSMLFELLTGRPLPLDSAEQQATIENELDGRGLTADVAKLIKHSLTDQVERWPDASIWKRRARKIMRDRDYQPSSETQESFLRTLFDDQPMAAPSPVRAVAQPAATVEDADVVHAEPVRAEIEQPEVQREVSETIESEPVVPFVAAVEIDLDQTIALSRPAAPPAPESTGEDAETREAEEAEPLAEEQEADAAEDQTVRVVEATAPVVGEAEAEVYETGEIELMEPPAEPEEGTNRPQVEAVGTADPVTEDVSNDAWEDVETESLEPLDVAHEPADDNTDMHIDAVGAAAAVVQEAHDGATETRETEIALETEIAREAEIAVETEIGRPFAETGELTLAADLNVDEAESPLPAVEPTSEAIQAESTEPDAIAREPEFVETPLPLEAIARQRTSAGRSKKTYLSLAAGVLGATVLGYLMLSSVLPAKGAPAADGTLAQAEESTTPGYVAAERQLVYEFGDSKSDVKRPSMPTESAAQAVPNLPQSEKAAAAEPEPATASPPTVAPRNEAVEPPLEPAETPAESRESEPSITTPGQEAADATDAAPLVTEAQADDAKPAAVIDHVPAGAEQLASTEVIPIETPSEIPSETPEVSPAAAKVPAMLTQPTPEAANLVASPESATVAASAADETLVEPRLLKINTPKYPLKARRLGLEGTVLVNAYVTQQGDVEEVKLVEGLGGKTGIDAAALRAVRSARFEAGSKQGVATAMWRTVAISFKLED